MTRWHLLCTVCSVWLLWGWPSALAVDEEPAAGFLISPSEVELTTPPGGVKVFSLTLINRSKERPSRFRMLTTDLEVTQEGRLNYPQAGSQSHSCALWLDVDPRELLLAPEQGRTILCKFRVPVGTPPSGRYAAVIAELVPEELKARVGTQVFFRLASVVKLTVAGSGIRKSAVIEQLRVEPWTAESGKTGLKAVAAVQNDGTIHVEAKGTLVIRDQRGIRMGQSPLEAGRGTILPGGIRDFTAEFLRALPPGEYTAEAILRYGGFRPATTKVPFSVAVGEQKASTLEGAESITLPGLSVTPNKVEQQVSRGGRRVVGLTVENLTEDTLTVSTSLHDVVADKTGAEQRGASSTSGSCAGWISGIPETITLLPRQPRRIIATIEVPPTAAKGIYQATLALSASTPQAESPEHRTQTDIWVTVP